MKSADVESRLWRQFAVLAETLHFGRAAERLSMTQPPLTQAIQLLERKLGVALFERTRRSVALTPAGAALLPAVRQWLADGARLAPLAREAAAGSVGRLRIGFVSTVAFGPLPGWLRAFRSAHPDIAVELREATGDVQLAAFAERSLDAGFLLHAPGMPPERSARLAHRSLGVEPLWLALPEASPLARATRLDVEAVLAEPLVIFPRAIAPSLYDAVLAFYHGRGRAPRIEQEAIQMQTIVNLVSAGIGVALVPRTVTLLQRPGVVYRALPRSLAAGAPRCETSMVWPADAAPVVRRFVDFVVQRSARRPRAAV